MATKREHRRRLSIVEQAIGERGWSIRLCDDLARELKATPRAVLRLRKELLDELADTSEDDERRQRRAQWLARVRGSHDAALRDGKYSAAASLLALEGKAEGFNRPMLKAPEDEPIADVGAPIDEKLKLSMLSARREIARIKREIAMCDSVATRFLLSKSMLQWEGHLARIDGILMGRADQFAGAESVQLVLEVPMPDGVE